MKTLRLKYFFLSFVTVLLVLVLIPLIFMLESSVIPLIQTNLETSTQVSLGAPGATRLSAAGGNAQPTIRKS